MGRRRYQARALRHNGPPRALGARSGAMALGRSRPATGRDPRARGALAFGEVSLHVDASWVDASWVVASWIIASWVVASFIGIDVTISAFMTPRPSITRRGARDRES
jgi:hypothetical protein